MTQMLCSMAGTTRLAAVFLLSLIIGGLTGCASYQMGLAGETTSIKSVHIEPVKNSSLAPQAGYLLDQNLREALLRSGAMTITDAGVADAILSVELVDFERDRSVANSSDSGRGVAFGTTLTALVTLVDAHSGAVYLEDEPFEVTRQLYATISLPEAEYQAMTAMTRDLADQIRNRLIY